jgi:MFS family permease
MTPLAPASRPPTPLRHNRDFRLLWCGRVASELGANSSQLAVPLLVLSITGSAGWAGAITTIGASVAAAGRLPGGALADRWNRRRLMVGSDTGRLLASLALGLCVLLERVSIPVVVVLICLIAILDVLFSPAETAAVSRLVPANQLNAAFSSNEARTHAASLAGRPLGGGLYGLGRSVPFLTASVCYLMSLLAVVAIRTPLQADRQAPKRSLISDIRAGVAHVAGTDFLRAVILVAAPLNFALNGAVFTVTIALRQAGISPGVIGLAQAAVGAGGLLGAFAASWLTRRVGLRPLVIVICAGLTVAIIAAVPLSGNPVMAVPLAAGFFLAPAANAALYARIGTTTPDHLQARVVSVLVLASTGAAALAPLACGLIITVGGAPVALFSCAAMLGVTVLIALASTGLRN